jgi:hypothetical protein
MIETPLSEFFLFSSGVTEEYQDKKPKSTANIFLEPYFSSGIVAKQGIEIRKPSLGKPGEALFPLILTGSLLTKKI